MSQIICETLQMQKHKTLPTLENQVQDRIITFNDYWSPPFIDNEKRDDLLCGPLVGLLKVFTVKHNYRFVY